MFARSSMSCCSWVAVESAWALYESIGIPADLARDSRFDWRSVAVVRALLRSLHVQLLLFHDWVR